MDDEDYQFQDDAEYTGEEDPFLSSFDSLESPESGLEAYARDPREAYLIKRAREKEAERKAKFDEQIKLIKAAKDRLLSQPAGPSRTDLLRQIATRLREPPKETDPRFWQKRNIFSTLRDIADVSRESDIAQKQQAEARQQQAAKLDALMAKYGYAEAGRQAASAQRELEKYKPSASSQGRTYELEKLLQMRSQLPQNHPDLPAINDRIRMLTTRSETGKVSDGRPSPTDIGKIVDDSRNILAPIKTKLTDVNAAYNLLSQARAGNAKASAQLDRYLATLAGDKQLSQLEVSSIAEASSFPGRVISGFNKFLTGVPSEMSLDEKEAVLDTLEKQVYAPAFNSERNRIISAYSQTNIPRESIISVVGGQYVPSGKKSQTIIRPPQGAIDMLRKNPQLASEFDKKYGVGASKRYLGE